MPVNVEYSENKQKTRQWLANHAQSNLNKSKFVKVLTFPSVQGIAGLYKRKNASFEGILRAKYSNIEFVGLECHKPTLDLIKDERMPVSFNLLGITDYKLFSKAKKYGVCDENGIDIAWLDYFGGTSRKNLNALRVAFKNQVFNNGAILGVTLCLTERTRKQKTRKLLAKYSQDGTVENGHFNCIKKCALKFGYIIDLIEYKQYKNSDVSIHARTMTTICYKLTKV